MCVAEGTPVLPDDIEVLKQVATDALDKANGWEAAYTAQLQAYKKLEEKFRILQHAFFGRSSEKWTVDEKLQARLFDEAELIESEKPDEPAPLPSEKQKPKKPRGKRVPLPESLPRKVIVHDISEKEKICGCGEPMVKIGEEISEELEIIPAKVLVRRHIRPKYGCKGCEGSGDEDAPAVKIAPVEKKLLPKSIASAGLVAYIITSKYCDALPLYRQEKIFSRIGVELKRSSMARWIMELGSRLSPLLALMDKEIRGGPAVLMDETRIQVHHEMGREDHKESYMWVARGGPVNALLARYMYHPTRSGNVAQGYLQGFTGFLQTDGYEGYRQIGMTSGIVHVGCLAHARRKFDDATKVSGGSPAAREFLSIIQKIYRVEKEVRGRGELSEEAFLSTRKEQALPLFEKLESHLEKKIAQVPPSSALGRAIGYLQQTLPRIKRYLDCPHLTPDTNAVERAIRPFTIGRKNWLFSDTPRGAHASAAFYSLIETAKLNKLEPYWYIRYVLAKLPFIEETGNWEALLPGNLSSETILAYS